MSNDCLFCHIQAKQIPAAVVYEDEATVAFLDIHPHALGHTIVIPRAHRETILDLRNGEVSQVFTAVQKVTDLLSKKLGAEGFTIGINHGAVSGQIVPHFHIHIMPRFKNDGGGSVHSVVNNPPRQTIEEVLKILKG